MTLQLEEWLRDAGFRVKRFTTAPAAGRQLSPLRRLPILLAPRSWPGFVLGGLPVIARVVS